MRLVSWSVALVLASGLCAQAQQPHLVRDINPIPDQRPGLEPTTLEAGAIGSSSTDGTSTVTHDGAYGALVGKAVALEPATGFSFDTPLTSRPR